jgi:hypothetical protein
MRAASVAGVLQLERCEGAGIHYVVVASDAGRGAIETVVGRAPAPLPSLRNILPERTGGVVTATPEPGAPPSLAPLAKRAEASEARARRDGATVSPRETWTAGSEGVGEQPLKLSAGCHRVELFPSDGKPSPRKARVDVDAEIRGEDDELLARDRTDAPDARLEACVGTDTNAKVIFTGAGSGSDVLVTRASWALPAKLADVWGANARARMAKALLARHVSAPREAPVFLAQGGTGNTLVPLSIEPGACYVVVAAVAFGHARGLGLRVSVGSREASDERGPNDDAGAVAFCAGEHERVRVDVEARGSSVAWGLALHRIEGRIWDVR